MGAKLKSKTHLLNTFFEKIEKVVKKRRISRWFRIRWKSFEKMYQKKVISKNVTEKCTFFTFTHVRQTCFAYNFFLVHFFTTFSTDSKSAWNSAFFDTSFDFFKKIFFWVILVLFLNFDCKCTGNGSKIRKIFFYECIFEFNYATIKGFA